MKNRHPHASLTASPARRQASARLFSALLAAGLAVSAAPSARALSNSWSVNADGSWATPGSWVGGVDVPGSTTTDNADIASFTTTLTAGRTVTVDATRYIGGIDFGNTSTSGYTLSTGTLNLNSGGVIQTLAANGAHSDTITAPITISGASGATATFTANATSSNSLLKFGVTSGTATALKGSASTGNTTVLTLNGTNNGFNIINSAIGDGVGGGKLAVVKDGSGTWELNTTGGSSAGNTYRGGTTLNAGLLRFGKAGSFGTGTLTINGGAIDVTVGISTVGLVQNWNGDFTFVGTGVWNANGGSVTLGGNTKVTVAASTLQIGGSITDGINDYSLTKAGAGILTLSTSNTISGNVTVEEGTLKINNGSGLNVANVVTVGGSGTAPVLDIGQSNTIAGLNDGGFINGTVTNTSTAITLTLGGSGTYSYGGTITATTPANLALTKSGSGTQTLAGANSYGGTTTINAGTLKLDYSTNSTTKLADAAALNLNGGTLELSGGSHTEVVSCTAIGGGTTFVTRSSGTSILDLGQINNLTQTAGTTNLSTAVTVADSSVLRVGMPITGTGIPNSSTIASIVNGTNITISAAATATGSITATLGTALTGAIDFGADNIATTTSSVTNGILSQRATVGGANFAMKSGANIVAYNYATSGVTDYTGAAMAANTNYLLTANGASTLTDNTGATSNTLKIANTATGSLAVAAKTLTTGAILFTGSADYGISTSGAGKIVNTLLHNYGTNGATLSLGALGGNLTQYGTGKTLLTEAATANNALTINGGSVQFSNNLQIGTNTGAVAITLNNGTLIADTSGASIALNKVDGTFARTVTLGAGGGTISVLPGATTNSLTVSGVVSGSGGLTKVGAGTLILSSANTYTGTTSVTGGTLLINGSSSGTGVVTVFSGATLGGAGTVGGATTINSGGFLATGNAGIGTQNFGAGLTINGTQTVEIGAVNGIASADKAAVTGALNLGAASTLALTNGGSAAAGSYQVLTNTGARTGTFNSVTNAMSSTLHETVVHNTNDVTVNLFRLAAASAPSATVNLGNIRVGSTALTGTASIGNTAANDGFSETLKAVVTGNGTGFTGVAGGGSGSVGYSLDASTAGAKTGSALVTLFSTSTNAKYGDTTLSTTTVALTGTAYDYASASFDSTTINFGTVNIGQIYTATINLTNAAGTRDNLDGTFTDALGFASASGFSGLAAGASQSVTVSFLANTAGSYSSNLVFSGVSNSQVGLTGKNLDALNIAISANVVSAIPEPATYAVLAGLGILILAAYRRRKTS